MIKKFLNEKNISVYKCAKLSGIPYSTLSDIVNGVTELHTCSANTVYRLSKVLNVSMETLMELSNSTFDDFEVFKSNIKHEIKELGDYQFIIKVYLEERVENYWKSFKRAEALYLVATVDYLSRINDLPLANRYDEYRSFKLEDFLLPKDVAIDSIIHPNSNTKEAAIENAIPEFLKYNIVEVNLRDAC